jgi:hypothetical protein
MKRRVRWHVRLIPLAAALTFLFPKASPSFATEPTAEGQYTQILLKHPQPHLSWATWKIVRAQEKAVASPLQARLLISVEKGVTKSVTIAHSTGFEAADLEVAHWVLTKWRFRPEITHSFVLPVYIIDDKVLPAGNRYLGARPPTLTKSEIAQGKKIKNQKLIISVDVVRGRVVNIGVLQSTGDPKLDADGVRWVTNNEVFAKYQTGHFQFPIFHNKKE